MTPLLLRRYRKDLPRFLGKDVRSGSRATFVTELVKHKEELTALPWVERQTSSNTELLDNILDEILTATLLHAFKSNNRPYRTRDLPAFGVYPWKLHGDLSDFISRPHEEPFTPNTSASTQKSPRSGRTAWGTRHQHFVIYFPQVLPLRRRNVPLGDPRLEGSPKLSMLTGSLHGLTISCSLRKRKCRSESRLSTTAGSARPRAVSGV